jgi:hypothetical protein
MGAAVHPNLAPKPFEGERTSHRAQGMANLTCTLRCRMLVASGPFCYTHLVISVAG